MHPDLYKEALEAGVRWYGNPAEIVSGEVPVDPLIRPAVLKINDSGWCWTAESCQGHPDANEPHPWAFNTEPMLRLVTRAEYAATMLLFLAQATRYPGSMERLASRLGIQASDLGESHRVALREEDRRGPMEGGNRVLRVCPHALRGPGWFEALVYVVCPPNVWERNQALQVFDRFAELAVDHARSKIL